MTDAETLIRHSNADFERIVWPQIKSICGGGAIIAVEGVTQDAFARTLDVKSGIDVWQVHATDGVRGIASRVQWGPDYRTFTIRKRLRSGGDTEWHKIQRWRDGGAARGFIRNHLIVQAYLDQQGGSLKAAYVVRAPDLYDLVRDDLEGDVWKERQVPGGNVMAVFPVAKLQRLGVKVGVVRPANDNGGGVHVADAAASAIDNALGVMAARAQR